MATRTLHQRTFCRRRAAAPDPPPRPAMPPRDPRLPPFGALAGVMFSIGCWVLVIGSTLAG